MQDSVVSFYPKKRIQMRDSTDDIGGFIFLFIFGLIGFFIVSVVHSYENNTPRVPRVPRNSSDESKSVYSLKCEGGRWYVGSSSNPTERFQQHLNGDGSSWTHLFPPTVDSNSLTIHPSCSGNPRLDEDFYVIQLMTCYGIDAVRGGSFSNPSLGSYQKRVLERMIRHARDECLQCGSSTHWVSSCLNRS